MSTFCSHFFMSLFCITLLMSLKNANFFWYLFMFQYFIAMAMLLQNVDFFLVFFFVIKHFKKNKK